MPRLLFTRQQLRRTACVTLLAWMFALLSGVANACLIQVGESGESGLDASPAGPMARRDARTVPTDPQAEHAHQHAEHERSGPAQDGGKAGCLKFCADETSTVTKGVASPADLPGPMLSAGCHWQLVTPMADAAPWPAVERPASVGPPLFLRLLRLTI